MNLESQLKLEQELQQLKQEILQRDRQSQKIEILEMKN
jgi:hypothetical protein